MVLLYALGVKQAVMSFGDLWMVGLFAWLVTTGFRGVVFRRSHDARDGLAEATSINRL